MEVVLFLCFLFLDLCVLEVVLTYKKTRLQSLRTYLKLQRGTTDMAQR